MSVDECTTNGKINEKHTFEQESFVVAALLWKQDNLATLFTSGNMFELIQCCIIVFGLVIFACLVIVSLAIGGYGFNAARYVYDHEGHIEAKSIISLVTKTHSYDAWLSLYVTLGWVAVLLIVVLLVVAVYILIKVAIKQACVSMFSCCRPARGRFYRSSRPEEYDYGDDDNL